MDINTPLRLREICNVIVFLCMLKFVIFINPKQISLILTFIYHDLYNKE